MLDPNIVFLNHGSFGACPRPVFEIYQAWQRKLEFQPVEFLGRQAPELLANARRILAEFLGVDADEVVYFTNPTTAVNMVARSLDLKPGDQVLTTDHEYGALDRTWRYLCQQMGAEYVRWPIPLPVTTSSDFIDRFWSRVNEKTRVVFISHITSPTALIFPVKEICALARQNGILSIVDGAHAPGQIPLNLHEIGADFYAGACHKWLMAPKGAAFIYARREVQNLLKPLVVSWGYESEFPSDSLFIDYHEWLGTRDLSAFLSVPAAIEFQKQYKWEQVRQECHRLAREARQRLNQLTGLEPICPDEEENGGKARWYTQMFTTRLPNEVDLDSFKKQLYEQYHIEAPMISWNRQKFIRVSYQGYNRPEDSEALLQAIREILRDN